MIKWMLLSPRWSKVWGDLVGNKLRTILVVMSISVGVFAVGMVYSSYLMFQRDLAASWNAASPASASVYADLFDQESVDGIRGLHGVKAAQGRRNLVLRALGKDGMWKQLCIVAIPDFTDQKVNIVRSQSGAWPPRDGEILIERSSLAGLGIEQGERVELETTDGRKRTLKVTGIVYDAAQVPTLFSGSYYGYISMNTLEKLDEERQLSQVDFVVQPWVLQGQDKGPVAAMGRKAWTKLEQNGTMVHWLQVNKPGEHPMQDPINAMEILLAVLGGLSLCLGTFLLINTISAILTQQVRQIGIMKAVGGRQPQIMKLYLTLVVCYGLLALVVAVPAGALAASGITGFMAHVFNFNSGGLELPPKVLFLEVIVAVLVPVIVAIWPVFRGVRVSVREAISDYGISETKAQGRIDRWVDKGLGYLKNWPRPRLLSLRNTFRRKGRLALTLVTLTVAGMVFMAVFSVRSSLYATLDQYLDYFHYDISMYLMQNDQADRVKQVIFSVPGVKDVEPWAYASGRLLKDDRKESEEEASEDLVLYGPPPNTTMIRPQVIEGRWFDQDDESAIVLTTDVVKDHPEIQVGGTVFIKAGNRKLRCTVVGITQSLLGPPTAYVPYQWMTSAMQETGKARWVQISAISQDQKEQSALGQKLEEQLKKNGMRVQRMTVTWELKKQIQSQFDIITTFLLIMAVLLAIVGALGLTGTMGINVIERTREIGVMRAIGASSLELGKVFIVEALCIGLISWFIGAVLAVPVAFVMSYEVGMLFLHHPLSFTISFAGVLIWLLLAVGLSVLASIVPAWNATRLSVRDVVSYE